MASKNAELDRLEGVYHRMLAAAKVDLINAHGSLIDPHTVQVGVWSSCCSSSLRCIDAFAFLQVGERTVTAERILIATGSFPHLPDFPGVGNVTLHHKRD